MKIIYRACEKVNSVNGLPRVWGCSKRETIELCFKSLVKALEGKEYELYIIGDSLSGDLIEFFKKTDPKSQVENYENLGNQQSILKSYEKADQFADNDVIYFCEDDYLHFYPSFYAKSMSFMEMMKNGKTYFFFHPTDYPDQYSKDKIKKSYVLANNMGHFREVSSATFTFMCYGKTYKKFSELFKDCAIFKHIVDPETKKITICDTGADDGRLSKIFGTEALCFSPLPGLASHCHEGTMSSFIEWDIVKEHINQGFPDKLKIKAK